MAQANVRAIYGSWLDVLKTKEIKKIVKIVKMVEVVKMNKVIKGPEKAVDSRRGQQRATRRWLQTWVKIETEQDFGSFMLCFKTRLVVVLDSL